MTIPGAAREPGSIMSAGGTELRTACGHSHVTCFTDQCFRLPPALLAERDRARTAALIEHEKNVARENDRFSQELIDIETTYRNLATEQSS